MAAPKPKKRCIFCDIANGKDPEARLLYSDEDITIFEDRRPVTTYHYLAVPKTHIKDAKVLLPEHITLVEKMVASGQELLHQKGCDTDDVRIGFHWPPFNAIKHLHLHIISPASRMKRFHKCLKVFEPNTMWFKSAQWVIDRLKQKLISSEHENIE